MAHFEATDLDKYCTPSFARNAGLFRPVANAPFSADPCGIHGSWFLNLLGHGAIYIVRLVSFDKWDLSCPNLIRGFVAHGRTRDKAGHIYLLDSYGVEISVEESNRGLFTVLSEKYKPMQEEKGLSIAIWVNISKCSAQPCRGASCDPQ